MTPTVLREGAFRVVIHTRESTQHHLPHVHVSTSDGEAEILLGDVATLPSPAASRGLKSAEERAALRFIVNNQTALLAKWEELHGG